MEEIVKYKIEIWQWHSITEVFESDDIKDVIEWYGLNWKYFFEMGYCAFNVYENGRELSFEEENNLGFH